jgi:Zn-dependent M16 (insulinase) family peptidase
MKKVKEVASHNRILQEYQHSSGFRHIHIPYAHGDISGCIVINTPAVSNKGLQHLIEHFVYLGAETYPGHDLYEMLRGKFMTTHVNAMTYPIHTMYDFISPTGDSFNKLLSVHLDMLLKPVFDPYSCAKEQYVVFNEMIGRMADGAIFQIMQAISRKAYGDTCPLAYMSGGYPEQVATVALEELRQFHANHYYPGNMTLLTVGPVDVNILHNTIEQQLQGVAFKAPTLVKNTLHPEAFNNATDPVKVFTTVPDIQGYVAYYPMDNFDAMQWSQGELLSDIFTHSTLAYTVWRDFYLKCDLSLKASAQIIECGYSGLPGFVVHLDALNHRSPMADHWKQYLEFLVNLDNEKWAEVLSYRKQRILNIMHLMDTTSEASSIIIERLKDRMVVHSDVLSRYEPANLKALIALCDDPESVKALIKQWLIDTPPVEINTISDETTEQHLAKVAEEDSQILLERMAMEAESAVITPKAPVAIQWPETEYAPPALTFEALQKGPVALRTYSVDNDNVSVLSLVFPIKNWSTKYLMSAQLVAELMNDLEFKDLSVELNPFYILRKNVDVSTLFNTTNGTEVAFECHIHYLTEYADQVLDILKAWLFEIDFTAQKEAIRTALMEYNSATASSTTNTWMPVVTLQAQQAFMKGLEPRLTLEANYPIDFLPKALTRPAYSTWQSVYETLFNSDVKIAHVTGLKADKLQQFNEKLCSVFHKKVLKKVVPVETDFEVANCEDFTTSNAMVASMPIPKWDDPDFWKFAILGQYLDTMMAREFRLEQGAYTAMFDCSPVGSYTLTVIDCPDNSYALQRLLEVDWLSDTVDEDAWDSAKLQYLQHKLRTNNVFEAALHDWDVSNGWLTQGGRLPTSIQNIVALDAKEMMALAKERLLVKGSLPWHIQIVGDVDISALEHDEVQL